MKIEKGETVEKLEADGLREEGKQTEEEIQQLARRLDVLESRQGNEPETEKEDTAGGLRRCLSSPLTASILALVAVVLTVCNIAQIGPFGSSSSPPSPQQLEDHLEGSLRFAAEEIEAYAEEHYRLPDNLSEIELSEEQGFQYEKLGEDSYRISVNLDGVGRSRKESLKLKEGEESVDSGGGK